MLAREVGGPLIEGVWGRGARPVDKSLYLFSGFPSWADKGAEVPFCSHSFAGPGLNGAKQRPRLVAGPCLFFC